MSGSGFNRGFAASGARFANPRFANAAIARGNFHGRGFHHRFGPRFATSVFIGSGLGYGFYDGYDPYYYDDSYAYDYGDDYAPYYVSSGYTCVPGTYFRGEDGRRYLCRVSFPSVTCRKRRPVGRLFCDFHQYPAHCGCRCRAAGLRSIG